ncbi:MAG: hypothetical protein U0793_33115 [Gemmataceae bacterium]
MARVDHGKTTLVRSR